jgi:hypothetical protein
MTAVDLDFIHGDSLVRNLRTPLAMQPAQVSTAKLLSRYPAVTRIALRSLPDVSAPLYEVTTSGRKVLIDARTGEELSPLPPATIRALAAAYYAGEGKLARLTLIERDPPSELGDRPLPLWRADFDDRFATSLYVHPDTGALVTRRHRFWRWFDFLWMLHIMDYDARENINNGLLRTMTVLGASTALSGLWMLYFSYRHKLPFRRKRALAEQAAPSKVIAP